MDVIINNLSFSLNATMPIFFVMVIGWCLKKFRFLDETTTAKLNQLVFKFFLPAFLFIDLATEDFIAIWDTKMVVFCFTATLLSIGIAIALSLFSKDKAERGEIIQASYRSGAATLGIVFMTNPIIIGILLGMLWSGLKFPQPPMVMKTVTYLGNIASPLALIALGASFELPDVKEKRKETLGITAIKLFLLCIIFLPIAIRLGFRNEKLVAILVMLGSATTSSSFIMSKNMGHRGAISSCAVMITTLLSSFTMTMWLFLLRTWNLI